MDKTLWDRHESNAASRSVIGWFLRHRGVPDTGDYRGVKVFMAYPESGCPVYDSSFVMKEVERKMAYVAL